MCEHFFALIKGGNSNPDPMQARVGASVESSANATLEATMFRSKAKTNTKGACVDREAYVSYQHEIDTKGVSLYKNL